MRIGTVKGPSGPRLVVQQAGALRPLVAEGELLGLLRSGTDVAALAVGSGAVSGPLAAPIMPGKVVAIGLNYMQHIKETGRAIPARPLVFAKFPSSVIGPEDAIAIDATVTERVDWEVELAVVVGRTMRRVARSEALDHVFGYTVANDVSARDVQFADEQWVRGKSLDTFCPLGPVIVTADELGDPQSLALRTRVNGEVVQESTTTEMIFSVAELLSFLSHSFTLDPGDVVLTGTPWGVGEFMDPPRHLAVGDVVEVEIDGIGTLRNPVIGVS